MNFKNHPVLCLYNMGSFLNDYEIPSKARKEILEIINKNKDIKKITLESRPEYVTKEHLEELKKLIPNKMIEIGMGLESSDDFVREVIINKGNILKDFKRTVKLIRVNKLNSLAYIQVKPPFLTEKEAIKDAIKTAKFCFNLGLDAISFEPTSLQKFTLPYYLFKKEKYRVSWLWSVIEIARKTSKLGEIRLGGYEYLPKPDITAFNCKKCSTKIKSLIDQFNGTYDITIFDNCHCKCKNIWEKELIKEDDRNIYVRILEDLK